MGTVLIAASLALAFAAPGSSAAEKPRKAGGGVSPSRSADRQARPVGDPISLDLKDADVKDVLRTFAELTKINIALDPDVRGSVTVQLHDVPWDQALDVILRMNGLGYVLEGRILRIGKPEKLLARD